MNVFCVSCIIRLKEQLIRELVKTGKDSESMNKLYADKIKALEKVRLFCRAVCGLLTSHVNGEKDIVIDSKLIH